MQLLHQLVATPVVYNFYNYSGDEKESTLLFMRFTEVFVVAKHLVVYFYHV